MIPRTSRTGTLRAVSAACAAAPSLLCLPLLIGAFLTVLWLLCSAAPAQADTSPAHPDAENTSATRGALPAEALTSGRSLGLDEEKSLEQVVPERVAAPVNTTLGTVHENLGKHTADTAAAAASLPEPAVTEVRSEVREVVTEIGRTSDTAVEQGLTHTLPATEARASRSAPAEPAEDGAEPRPRGDEEADRPEAETGRNPAVLDSAAAPHHIPAPAGDPAEAAGTAEPDHGAADRAPEHQRVQQTTGSPAPTANGPASAPSVAGYLTSAPLPAPAADTMRLAAHRLHAVPVDPADDPTVSPD
ncbi:hypothetical protein GCM10007079_02100 [Nocardiopsis terrae]|uniref:Secreted protein n=1 Tax=Nocardiopsis terrae TaxID=372655 RepID=A0ABR9HML4_9ACTN|nr:hypothetical protein [Nocardiopsis terrae]MBE1460263.1 hypothetical protein [Nocardiopsis terrae]GHC70535.1 hypothetical protein GCM10007079_02100 [Nocardiopsis terrae]